MTLKELEQKRREKGYTFRQIAELSGLSEEVVICALGRMEFPGYEAMKCLEYAFQTAEMKNIPGMIKEAAAAYGEEGRLYTIEDYYAIPDERRVELIDGVIYDMTAPMSGHQLTISRISNAIQNYIDKKRGKCLMFVSPIDVQLDCDNKTMVQPDILILCDRSKLRRRGIMGAPDFIVEILSDSTRKKDMTIKLQKYKNAGVREYWMIDWESERVIAYEFEHGDIPLMYGFDGKIPVGIFGGDLKIDFQKIREKLAIIPED